MNVNVNVNENEWQNLFPEKIIFFVCFLNINLFYFLEWTTVQRRAAIVSSWKKLSGRRMLGSSGEFIN